MTVLSEERSQQQVAKKLGVPQFAISQQLRSSPDMAGINPRDLVEAGAPVLKTLGAEHGFTRLAVFGSVARGDARTDSDVDPLVEARKGTSSLGSLKFQKLLESVLGRDVDLVDNGGLKPGVDDGIRR